MLKFTQTTNGALSSFQYIRKANPTGNRENWGGGHEGEGRVGVDTGPVPGPGSGPGPTSWAEGGANRDLNLNIWAPPAPPLAEVE